MDKLKPAGSRKSAGARGTTQLSTQTRSQRRTGNANKGANSDSESAKINSQTSIVTTRSCSFRDSTLAKRAAAASTTIFPSTRRGKRRCSSSKSTSEIKQVEIEPLKNAQVASTNTCQQEQCESQLSPEPTTNNNMDLSVKDQPPPSPLQSTKSSLSPNNTSCPIGQQTGPAKMTCKSESQDSIASSPQSESVEITASPVQVKVEEEIEEAPKSFSPSSEHEAGIFPKCESDTTKPLKASTPSGDSEKVGQKITLTNVRQGTKGDKSYECSDMNRTSSNSNTGSSSARPNSNTSSPMDKNTIVPMVLMNNLPYMGELTFDTRPRRGRKPKKADICHLISKNYGIQFPNSYVNVPLSSLYTATPPPPSRVLPNFPTCASTPPSFALNSALTEYSSPSRPAKASGSKSAKNKLLLVQSAQPNFPHCYNTALGPGQTRPSQILGALPAPNRRPVAAASKANNRQQPLQHITVTKTSTSLKAASKQQLLAAAAATWTGITPPDLLPLAASPILGFKNNNNNNNNYDQDIMKPISIRPLKSLAAPSDDDDDYESLPPSSPGTIKRADAASAEQPLNLCMRDTPSPPVSSHPPPHQMSPLNLLSQVSNCHVKPSANNLFNSFNLKRNNKPLKTVSVVGSERRTKSVRSSPHQQPAAAEQQTIALGGHQAAKSSTTLSSSATTSSKQIKLNSHNNLVNFNIHLSGGPTSKFLQQPRFPAYPDHLNLNLQLPISAQEMEQQQQIKKPRRRRPPQPSKASKVAKNSDPYRSPNPPTVSLGDSAANAAEVSICKFKFTGGAKPSLQEKKMLAVDATGNFRFYSDKPSPANSASGLRGPGPYNSSVYTINSLLSSNPSPVPVTPSELYPEVSLSLAQAQALQQKRSKSTSPPGLSNRSILSDIHQSPPSAAALFALSQLPHHHLQQPPPPVDFDPANDCSSSSDDSSSSQPFSLQHGDDNSYIYDSLSQRSSSSASRLGRKRRTRKSVMREKLEKTFKEKGFLIQTQQLESAEGATYCKFRQLRKFTRYLFRSWKDYLPEGVQKIGNKNQQSLLPPQDPEAGNLVQEQDPEDLLDHHTASNPSDQSEEGLLEVDSNNEDGDQIEDDRTTASSPPTHHSSPMSQDGHQPLVDDIDD